MARLVNNKEQPGESAGNPAGSLRFYQGEIMTSTQPLIRMKNITKKFPGVIANDKVNLDLYPGQIHALAGRKRQRQEYLDEYSYWLVPAYGRQY
jgi:ABC-type glutathione transport system ATPase component